MPPLYHTTLKKWMQKLSTLPAVPGPEAGVPRKQVYLFCDEFTNYLDTSIGIAPIRLLQELGYTVSIPRHLESGRAGISNGVLRKAKKIAQQTVRLLAPVISEETTCIGIELPEILTFRVD